MAHGQKCTQGDTNEPTSFKLRKASLSHDSVLTMTPMLGKHAVKWKCLIADDLAFNRILLKRKLLALCQNCGLDWTIHETATGEEVLELTEQPDIKYNFFVIDENFDSAGGILKGREVIEKIRLGPSRDAVVVSCSGNNSPEVEFSIPGADLIFCKPTPAPQEIASLLEELLLKRCMLTV
ncbi:hypothetical protein CYMTET_12254 [Cymbomonas tetramitiformis]|uniref:Response regulatory domain-containing protein n=1 Tax=Cymbomonas tetramitiformis TaxID=36881 RepID=A0AAE0GKX6_9CHLO|nr:hypothetical protein CYMTET_12254 [Cymbomonas tetramitiformis]